MSFNIADFFPKLSIFGSNPKSENADHQSEHKGESSSYEMNILHGGYVYCILPMKFDLETDKVHDNKIPIKGQFVVKVGMSSYENIEDRLKRYGLGTVVLAKIFCMNHGTMEKIILAEFRKQFPTFVGAEYFLARPDEALHLFLKVYATNVVGAVGNIKIPAGHGARLKNSNGLTKESTVKPVRPNPVKLPRKRPTVVVPTLPETKSIPPGGISNGSVDGDLVDKDSAVKDSASGDSEHLDVLVGMIEKESTKSLFSQTQEFLGRLLWPTEVKSEPVYVGPLVETREGIQPLDLYSPPHTKVPQEYFRSTNISNNPTELERK